MANPITNPPNLTGQSSVFPYGLDQIEFQNNYESSDIDEQGDIVRATYRNHLADVVLKMEAELLSVSNSYEGDMRVSAYTIQVNDWVPGATMLLMIPLDVAAFIFGDLPIGEAFVSTLSPIVIQATARPLDKLAIWADQYDYRGAMHLSVSAKADGAWWLQVKMVDPVGYLASHSSYSGDPNLGNFILSVILFRQI